MNERRVLVVKICKEIGQEEDEFDQQLSRVSSAVTGLYREDEDPDEEDDLEDDEDEDDDDEDFEDDDLDDDDDDLEEDDLD